MVVVVVKDVVEPFSLHSADISFYRLKYILQRDLTVYSKSESDECHFY